MPGCRCGFPSGEALGTLAALDRAPRPFAGNELATLRMLADIVVEVAESRLGGSEERERKGRRK